MSCKTCTTKRVGFLLSSYAGDLLTLKNPSRIRKEKTITFSFLSVSFLFIVVLLSSSSVFANVNITKGTDPSFCTSTYPSPYVGVGTFSLNETKIKGKNRGFTAGQTNET